MLDVGSYAFDNVSGSNVQILEKIDVWGYVSYRVYNPDTGEVICFIKKTECIVIETYNAELWCKIENNFYILVEIEDRDTTMKKEIDKEAILKIIQRQMIAFLILLIAVGGGFMYLSNQISELQQKVTTMNHELDYAKGRIVELEKNQ